MADTNLVFLPWVRRGMAVAIGRPDRVVQNPPVPVTTFAVSVKTAAGFANTNLPLIGPGDIAGLDARVIVRTRPGRDESDAELNHFVSVDIDQADLPWRYTPAAQTSQRLTPWLTLIVLEDTEWTPVAQTSAQKLPAAMVTKTTALPPLDKAWASAHVQLHGSAETVTTKDQLAGVLQGQPGLFVARLLCPRVLNKQRRYTAMLVPSFQRGVLAGLGQAVPDTVDALTLAWTRTEASVTLPIYYQWQFQTGVVGDFKDLARSLVPTPIGQNVGYRNLDVSKPGFDLPNAAVTPTTNPPTPTVTATPMEGALQSLIAPPAAPALATDWKAKLDLFVNSSSTSVNNVVRPLVAPPLYGRWHAREPQLADGARPWFRDLNRDPRHRSTAGLGTIVVEERQQELMSSAWAQVEGLREANAERKVLQLGREAFARAFTRHLTPTKPDSALATLALLHRWVIRPGAATTIHAELAGSLVGRAVFDPQWRRFTRPRGALGRRQGRLTANVSLQPATVLAGGFQPAPPPPLRPAGMLTASKIFGGLVLGTLTPAEIATVAARTTDAQVFWGILIFCAARKLLAAGAGSSWPWLLRLMRFGIGLLRLAGGQAGTNVNAGVRDGTLSGTQVQSSPGNGSFHVTRTMPGSVTAPPAPTGSDTPEATAFRAGMAAMLNAYADQGALPALPSAINVSTTAQALLTGLAPSVTLAASPLARLHIDPSIFWKPVDDLEPVQAAPSFPQAMWTALRDESVDWILPGLQQVGTNTVGLVQSNQRFVEAFMVGLNHEMARTLLWNGYPTDQRGTYFRQFWDSRATPGTVGDLRDINVITSWPSTSNLGANSPRTTPAQAVLLVRGDLIRRYPNTVVYAIPGNQTTNFNAPQTTPVFAGLLTRDVSFYGFPIAPAAVQGNPGFAFVLQEQPTEPRFAGPPATTPVEPTEPAFVLPDVIGANTAGEFAAITHQGPTRVVIPGNLLVPPPPA